MENTTLQQALDNMRGGCAHNFDSSDRKPGPFTNLEYNVARWKEKYGTEVPEHVLNYWKTMS